MSHSVNWPSLGTNYPKNTSSQNTRLRSHNRNASMTNQVANNTLPHPSEASSSKVNFKAVLQKDSETHSQTMKEIDDIINELKNLSVKSESLLNRAPEVKLTEVTTNKAGKKAVRNVAKEFIVEINKYKSQLDETSAKVLYTTDKVQGVLEGLNKLTAISSPERNQLRDDFTKKWNQICLESYSLRWDLDYLLLLSDLPPALKGLQQHLDDLSQEVTLKKKDFQEKTPTDEEWVKLNDFFIGKQKLFQHHNNRAVENEKTLHSVVQKLKPQVLPEEYLNGFAAHNDELKIKNHKELDKSIQNLNKKREDLKKSLENQWKRICDSFCDLSLQLRQVGYGVDNKTIPLKTSVNLESVFVKTSASIPGVNYATGFTTDYAEKLEGYAKPMIAFNPKIFA